MATALGLTPSEHGALDEIITQHLRLEPLGMVKFDNTLHIVLMVANCCQSLWVILRVVFHHLQGGKQLQRDPQANSSMR